MHFWASAVHDLTIRPESPDDIFDPEPVLALQTAYEQTLKATEIFFRSVYGQPRNAEQPRSFMDTILGNLCQPLTLDEEEELDLNPNDADLEQAGV